jgi:hypothetical protein
MALVNFAAGTCVTPVVSSSDEMVKRECLGHEDALQEGDENEVYICGVAW